MQALLVSNKKDYEAKLLLGRSLASHKMLANAEAAFKEAIEINEQDIRGWQVRHHPEM